MGIREDAAAEAAAQKVSDRALRDAEAALAASNAPDDVASAAFDTAMTGYAEREHAVGDTVTVGGVEFTKRTEFGGAPEPQGNGRHGVPDTHVYDPQTASYGAPGAPQQELNRLREVAPAPRPATPTVVQGTALHLTPQQYDVLLRGINPNRVKERQGQSHLEAWDVRRNLTRIFGFGGFDIKTLKQEKIFHHIAAPGEIVYGNGGSNKKPAYTVVYEASVQLTIKNPDGSVGAVFEDGATGDGVNMPTYQAAADFALKTALSQALKRCAVNLGDQFGLSLYDGGNYNPVVKITLAGPVIEGGEVADQVTHSEPVRSEEETPAYLADPGQHPDADPDNGLPSVSALREEVLDPSTSANRLSAIYQMVNRKRGTHPNFGPAEVTNENGNAEPLDGLVYRKIQERKQQQ